MKNGVHEVEAGKCPSLEVLQDLLVGQLRETDLDRVAVHVESCSSCEDQLNELDDFSDSLIAPFRSIGFRQWAKDYFPTRSSGSPFEPPFVDETLFSSKFDPDSLPDDVRSEVATIVNRAKRLSRQKHVPEQIGPYKIVEFVGRGGMGSVYRARHGDSGVETAIKVLPAGKETSADLVARFQRELTAMRGLSHPNLVAATDSGTDAGFHYFVMEYVAGVDASAIVNQLGPLAVADACEIVRQGACGLQHLHLRGLIHRDVKPSNVRISHDGTLKVLDMGLSRHLPGFEQGDDSTAIGMVLGTYNYMSPEQIQGNHDIDQRSDIYSLGCTLYHLLAGRAPFAPIRKQNMVATLVAHCTGTVEPLRDRRADVPRELASVVEQMMAKAPQDRIGSAAAVAELLEPFCARADLVALVDRSVRASPKRSDVELTTRNVLADPDVGTIPNHDPTRRALSRRSRYTPVFLRAIAAVVAFGLLGVLVGFPIAEMLGTPTPIQVELLDQGKEHDLLQNEPPVSWRAGPPMEPETIFQGAPPQLVAVGIGERLYRLGSAKNTNFELQAELLQGDWLGNTGVYFGLQPVATDKIEYHRIVIRRFPKEGQLPAFRLVWQKVTAQTTANWASDCVDITSAPVSPPIGRATLSLRFDEHGLAATQFNNELITWQENAAWHEIPPADMTTSSFGEFGLWNNQPGTRLTKAVVTSFPAAPPKN